MLRNLEIHRINLFGKRIHQDVLHCSERRPNLSKWILFEDDKYTRDAFYCPLAPPPKYSPIIVANSKL